MKKNSDVDIIHQIVRRIAEADGVDPLDLPPLAWVVDVDALESFFTSNRCHAFTEFEYQNRTITIEGDGTITMSDQNDGTFVCRCHTCGEAIRSVDHQTAQAFFADHLDQDHEPELFRINQPDEEQLTVDQPTDADGETSGGAARTD